MQGQSAIVVVAVGHALAIIALIMVVVGTSLPLVLRRVSPTPTPLPSAGRLVETPPRLELPTVIPMSVAAVPPPATPEPTPAPTPAPSPTLLPVSAVDTGGRGARLRQEPSIRADVVAMLPDRTQVAQVGADEAENEGRRWRLVRGPDGRGGWIDASLLLLVGTPGPDADGATEPATPTPVAGP